MREKLENMIGRRYGLLKVISITKDRRCLCACDCGQQKIIYSANLKSGRTKSCGCLEKQNREKRKKNLKGQKFGQLLVLEETDKRIDGSIIWKCLCECGTVYEASSRNLLRGDVKSCGCMTKKKQDITGQKFGKLKAIKQVGRTKRGVAIWLCKCECGKKKEVQIDNLRSGHTRRCGCLQDRSQLKIVDKTNLTLIQSKKLYKNNKSGIKGVSYNQRLKKWDARLTFRGKVHWLGYYDDLLQAAKARIDMERIYEEYLKNKG